MELDLKERLTILNRIEFGHLLISVGYKQEVDDTELNLRLRLRSEAHAEKIIEILEECKPGLLN